MRSSYLNSLKKLFTSNKTTDTVQKDYTALSMHDNSEDSANNFACITDTDNVYNPLFKVTIAGVTKKSKVCMRTNRPVWTEDLKFYMFFPYLVGMIKFELCTQDLNGTEEILATEYLDIDSISSFKGTIYD